MKNLRFYEFTKSIFSLTSILLAVNVLSAKPAVAAEGQQVFAKQKVQIASSDHTPEDKLLVVIDPDCWERNSMSWNGLNVTSKVYPQHLSQIAVAVEVPHVMAADSVYSDLEHNTCVQGVTKNPDVYLSATDPLLENQAARISLQSDQGEQIFFHPLHGIQQSVVIAVVDTGVRLQHPDLAPRLWRGPAGEQGYDFANSDTNPNDDNGHGTHVAGLIGAQQKNSLGIRGTMGDRSLIMPVKVLKADGNGTMADVVNGIRWAVERGAQVVNLSLSAKGTNAALENVIAFAISRNVVVVVAAGNDGQLISDSSPVMPAYYARNNKGLISVGSYDAHSLIKSMFSNFNPSFVKIGAPGSDGEQGILSTFTTSDYRYLSGTSMSSPQVAGAAALAIGFLKTQGKATTAAGIEDLLKLTAVKDPSLAPFFDQGNRLNLYQLGLRLMRDHVVDSAGGFDE